MRLRLSVTIILLSLLFFFGLKKITNNKIENKNKNISESNIIRYLPRNNKLFFISNLDISNNKDFNTRLNTNQKDDLVLLKNGIFAYLGVDIGNEKLENIYNNELIISTYENKIKSKDDILIVFKIKQGKNIDDLLNLPDKIDNIDEILPIIRENKLSYLKYIYRTSNNYIIASSNKKLISDSLDSNNKFTKTRENYLRKTLSNFKDEKNILFKNVKEKNLYFVNEFPLEIFEDNIATTFSLKNENLILKSYLINDKNNLNIANYDDLTNENIKSKNKYQNYIYSDLEDCINYLFPSVSNFEKSFLKELKQISNYNTLLLTSKNKWMFAFQKDNLIINDLQKIKNLNKYSLEKNDNIFSIYSKDILEEKNDIVKKTHYGDIYSIDSEDLFLVSNNLISSEDVNFISDKFNELNNINKNSFLFKKIDVIGINFYKNKYFSDNNDLNFLLKNLINVTNEEFIEVVKQSIPEKQPIYYSENKFKILN